MLKRPADYVDVNHVNNLVMCVIPRQSWFELGPDQ